MNERQKLVLSKILELKDSTGMYPLMDRFRAQNEGLRGAIDTLVEAKLLLKDHKRYKPSLVALQRADLPLAEQLLGRAAILVASLREAYRENAGSSQTTEELLEQAGLHRTVHEAALDLIITNFPCTSGSSRHESGRIKTVTFSEAILDLRPIDVLGFRHIFGEAAADEVSERPRLLKIRLSGFRAFRDVELSPNGLTVVIGANGTGKSSLFDFLQGIKDIASGQRGLSRWIMGKDEKSLDRVFHLGMPAQAIGFELQVQQTPKFGLSYSATVVRGKEGLTVDEERVASLKPLVDEESEPTDFLVYSDGDLSIRDPGGEQDRRLRYRVPVDGLALTQYALEGTGSVLSRLKQYLASWRFYLGFFTGIGGRMRNEVPSEEAPVLAVDGGNLSSVLLWLKLNEEEIFNEIESVAQMALPGFKTLRVRPTGKAGNIIGSFQENGHADGLTLSQMSDGSLKFLCLAALCLSPEQAPLICIDEPDSGLHPRALPILAALIERASERTQIIVATHSPFFLTQFKLPQVAVMTKEDGESVIKRPNSSKALRELVREIVGDALAELMITDELEALA